MKTHNIFLTVLAILVVGFGAYWLFGHPMTQVAVSPSPTVMESPTPTTIPSQYDQSVSDGIIKVSYSSGAYGLATTPTQIQVKSYIPPCDSTFKYCLYYNGTAYTGTNFESAGLRIQKRIDLTAESPCLSVVPAGYTTFVPVKSNGPDYSTSVFSPIGDAGAGHYASGAIYRLWVNNSCYELETRIGETQFANYPAGTIQQFTDLDRENVNASLRGMVDNIMLSNGEKILFPQPASSK